MPEPSPIDFTDPNYLAAREAALRAIPAPVDDTPWRPTSFAEALRVSEKITSDYRELHRPNLEVSELEFVIRFKDPGDVASDGQPKPVIDLMLPWAERHATILKKHVVVDSKTGMRLPSLEAAIACKYATLISPHRLRKKKLLDESDFNSLVSESGDKIDRDALSALASLIWENGGPEIIEFIELSLADKPLPI